MLFDSLQILLSTDSQSDSCKIEFIEKRRSLIIHCKLLAREMTWTFPMERLESTADVKCEFLVRQDEELTARVKHLEIKNSEDFAMRLKQLEKLLGVKKGIVSHVFQDVAVSNCTLSNDRKTVMKSLGSSSSFQAFMSEQPITATDNTFTVIINSFGTDLEIGVAKREITLQGGLYSQSGAFLVYFSNGSTNRFYNSRAEITPTTRVSLRAGSSLTVRFDALSNKLSFEIDGTALLPVLTLADINASQLFPVVDLYNPGQSISFV